MNSPDPAKNSRPKVPVVFATTRSARPSPSKSETAIAVGFVPVLTVAADRNVPLLFSKTRTSFVSLTTAAMSGSPSLSRSDTATATVCPPVLRFTAALNAKAPGMLLLFVKIETPRTPDGEFVLATITSARPSALISRRTTSPGMSPAVTFSVCRSTNVSPPVFSNSRTLSSVACATARSRSPSPSRSAAETASAPDPTAIGATVVKCSVPVPPNTRRLPVPES